MFRLKKKRGRRHKSADSLLAAAPVEQQQKKEATFALALADLQHKDALVEVFLNDGSHHSVLLSAGITAREVVESVVARLPDLDDEEYQLYVQFKFGYGRLLEDHTVLSELGDDWGPLIRMALWTRERRLLRTRSSEDLLSHSTQSLCHPTPPTKGSSDLYNSQDLGHRQRHYTLGFESLSHQELPRAQLGVPHPHSWMAPPPDCSSSASPPTRSTSTANLTRSSAFRESPLRIQGHAGEGRGKPLALHPGDDRRISQQRKTVTRRVSVPNQVQNTVATDTRVMVFEDGWSCTQSMPTTPTHPQKLTDGSTFPFLQDSQTSLFSTEALSSSTQLSDALHASGVSIDCSASCSESNLDRPFVVRAPSRDKQVNSSDYFDRLDVMNGAGNNSDTSTQGSSEDYFDRLEPTLKDYFDHLEAPVVTMTQHNWDKVSFLQQQARSQIKGAPPPKPFRGPTPAPIAEAIEKWNSKLRKSRVMRITATLERQNESTKDSDKPKPKGKSSLPSGLRSIFRMPSRDKGSKSQPKASAPRHHIARHSEGSTSLSNLCAALPSSAGNQRRSSSLTNLKICRVQPQPSISPPSVPHPSTSTPSVPHPSTSTPSVPHPSTSPPSVPHPTISPPSVPHPSASPPSVPRSSLDRISRTSVDSALCQHLFPDGKIQRLRKRTSETSESLDEEHLRLTAEEVQALYAATLGPMLRKERTSHLEALARPPAPPPRSASLCKSSLEDDQLRETLLTVLLEPTLDDSHTFPQLATQWVRDGPADCPLVAVAQSNQ